MRFVKRALAIIITAFVIINLTACGQSPTAVSESFLTAVKEGDVDTIEDLYVDSEFRILNLVNYPDSEKKASEKEEFDEFNEFNKAFDEEVLTKMRDFDFEISNEQVKGDEATVDVAIKTYDIGSAYSSYFNEYISQAFALAFSDVTDEQLDSIAAGLLTEKFSSLTEKTFEKTAKMRLVKRDNKWKVDTIDQEDLLVDALSGDLASVTDKLEETWGN